MIRKSQSSNVNGNELELVKLSNDRLCRESVCDQNIERTRIRAAHIYTTTNCQQRPNTHDVINPPPTEEIRNKKNQFPIKERFKRHSLGTYKDIGTQISRDSEVQRHSRSDTSFEGTKKKQYPSSRTPTCPSRSSNLSEVGSYDATPPHKSLSLRVISNPSSPYPHSDNTPLRKKSSKNLELKRETSKDIDCENKGDFCNAMQKKKRSLSKTSTNTKNNASGSNPGGNMCNCMQNALQMQCQMAQAMAQAKKKGPEQYLCSCRDCGNMTSCFCLEDLDAIEEEQDCDMWGERSMCGSGKSEKKPKEFPPPPSCEEEDPCSEFLDIMRDSMEEAVKKSLEESFCKCFSQCLERIENLATQMERNACVLGKIYADLNDKISYYGERNAQQFQYLCVRMEHDRLFYQQQQEYYLNAKHKEEENTECQEPTIQCHVKKIVGRCNVCCGEKHSRTSDWECQLTDGQETVEENAQPATSTEEVPAERSQSKSAMRQSKSPADQRQSKSAGEKADQRQTKSAGEKADQRQSKSAGEKTDQERKSVKTK